MAWTEEQIRAYEGGKSYEEVDSMTGDSQPVVEETNSTEVNVETPEAETTAAETSEVEKPVEEETSTSQVTEESPEKAKAPVNESKKKFLSHEDKVKHSFAKLTSKNKALREELEAIKAKLSKYEGLTKEDFNNDEETYNDYKFDRRWDSRRAAELENEVERNERELQEAQWNEINEKRLEACFPTETDQLKYKLMIGDAENNWDKKHPEYQSKSFTEWLMKEKDGSVLSYLRDSDNSPKLIRHFIAKPEVANRIMNMSNPYNKFYELKQLENRMLQHERVEASKAKLTQKKELPDTGDIVKNTNSLNKGFDFDRPWTEADILAWENNKGKSYS